MKEQKDLEKTQPEETLKQQDMPKQKAAPVEPTPDMGDDDNVATAEEMEAFIRDRREKEREKKEKREDDGTKLALKWHLQGTDTGINPWYIGIVPNWDWAMNAASGLSGSGFFHARLYGRR
jgi:hypothetical protein